MLVLKLGALCILCWATILCHWAISVALKFLCFFFVLFSYTGHQTLAIACTRQVPYHWATSPRLWLAFSELSYNLAIYFRLALKHVITLTGLWLGVLLPHSLLSPGNTGLCWHAMLFLSFFLKNFQNDYTSLRFHWQSNKGFLFPISLTTVAVQLQMSHCDQCDIVPTSLIFVDN